MKTLEEVTKELETLQGTVQSQGKTIEEHSATIEAQGKTITEHVATIKKLSEASASAPVSSIAKAAEKPKVPTKEDLDKARVDVTYNENANKKGASAKSVKGNFSIKVPTLHYKGKVVLAAEALKSAEIMTWFVENTWLGPKNKSPFVQEWV